MVTHLFPHTPGFPRDQVHTAEHLQISSYLHRPRFTQLSGAWRAPCITDPGTQCCLMLQKSLAIWKLDPVPSHLLACNFTQRTWSTAVLFKTRELSQRKLPWPTSDNTHFCFTEQKWMFLRLSAERKKKPNQQRNNVKGSRREGITSAFWDSCRRTGLST